jgi:Ca2+-binding EF-hand superfamily protein
MIAKLALQFPLIKHSFTLVHDIFCKYYRNHISKSIRIGKNWKINGKTLFDREVITLDQLGDLLKNIGEHRDFSNEEIQNLFHLADLDNSKTISFHEFLICISIGYFLKIDSEHTEFLEIQKGFKVVQQAFHDMDIDHNESVSISELKKALFASSNDNQLLLEQRFAELDFNHDGNINFPEFLYGFVSWVGFDTEEALEIEAETNRLAMEQK